MNVLVIAPHPDDETIGCGGSILLHARQGDRVVTVFLTSGELGLKHLSPAEAWRIREGEARRAGRRLGLADMHFLRQPDWYLNKNKRKAAAALRPLIRAETPGLIYLPHPAEWHPDHKAVLKIVQLALKGIRTRRPKLLGYEVWTPLGEFDEVTDTSKVMQQKLRALRFYRSQLKEFDYVRAVNGLNQYRGQIAARCAFAEVFQTL